ncbi:MAG: hypothetical protein ACXABY_17895 [Candidatus Thorarchaeota archaeon]
MTNLLSAMRKDGKLFVFEQSPPDLDTISTTVLRYYAIMIVDISKGEVLKNKYGLTSET